LGVTLLLAGVQMAGELIGRVGGLAMADVFDPTFNDNTPLFSRLLTLVSTAVFLAIGGHRVLMAGLLDTFQAIPPGGGVAALWGASSPRGPAAGMIPALAGTVVLLVSQSFQLAIRAAAPIVTALLLATLVLGLISRTLPQLNILVLGFGVNAILTFAVFSVALGAMALAFQSQVEPTLQILFQALRVPWHGM
jgi:flagellar biosynthetic protein FliR